MDKLDWRYDKGGVIMQLVVQAVLYALVTIVAGFLLHVGWDLYGA